MSSINIVDYMSFSSMNLLEIIKNLLNNDGVKDSYKEIFEKEIQKFGENINDEKIVKNYLDNIVRK